MPEPPEIAYENATPQQLLERLDILRERFRMGVMSVADFNTAIRAFQFKDDIGHLWAPGATSDQWYRWDLDQWTPAEPPRTLLVSQSPVLFTDFEQATRPRATGPAVIHCGKCGTPNSGNKFCTKCGNRLR